MRLLETRLRGPLLLESVVHGDERGFFQELYRRNRFAELGIEQEMVQHNHSRSRRGSVRGMHFQPGMGKLVRCVRGAILDVLVDLRRGSPSFGEWEGFELSDRNHHALYCPDGFGHGFCALSETVDVLYGCTTYYDAALEGGFNYGDPDVGIEWPQDIELIISPRDAGAPMLAEIVDTLPFRYD
jgi:dTDP-4-dehydrorhamnose 3,5-epimerase